jgi:DNA invertase Pin-like site-specific DNA recombinase
VLKPTDEAAVVSASRHVLPKDLPNAIKHLSDEELDRLIMAALAELRRRRRRLPMDKAATKMSPGLAKASLTRGQLNAVRAAFKAGVTASRIARQFGLSQSDVRKALVTDHSGEEAPTA